MYRHEEHYQSIEEQTVMKREFINNDIVITLTEQGLQCPVRHRYCKHSKEDKHGRQRFLGAKLLALDCKELICGKSKSNTKLNRKDE